MDFLEDVMWFPNAVFSGHDFDVVFVQADLLAYLRWCEVCFVHGVGVVAGGGIAQVGPEKVRGGDVMSVAVVEGKIGDDLC